MQKQKGFSSILIIVIIALLVIGATGLVVYLQTVEPGTDQSQKLIACAQDAKQCPDGSYVSRVPPNCSFAPCPEVQDETVDWKTYKNEDYGFQLKYPSNWNLEKIKPWENLWEFNGPEGMVRITYNVLQICPEEKECPKMQIGNKLFDFFNRVDTDRLVEIWGASNRDLNLTIIAVTNQPYVSNREVILQIFSTFKFTK